MQPQSTAEALQALCDQGLALHQAGRLDEARARYDAVLRQDPLHFNALYLLGMLYAQAGHPEPGSALLRRAIGVNPNAAAAHGLLGVALIELKRPVEALELINRALALDPSYADAHYSRGLALSQMHRHEEALACYDATIALAPNHVEAYNNRGLILGDTGRADEALANFETAIRLWPDFAEAHNNRGLILHTLGRDAASLESCERAIALKPDYPNAHFNRGVALMELKRSEEALASYRASIAIDPEDARALAGQGLALQALQRHEEAIASLDKAIALRPDIMEAHNNRGNSMYELARLDEALASYDAALALKPDNVVVRTNRAAALLLAGRFEAGWREVEWRKKSWIPPWSQLDPASAWLGEADPAGKRLFIHHEQGLGDTIQFWRYIAVLRGMGADPVCSVQPPLKTLLQRGSPDCLLLTGDEQPPSYDYHCSIMSLPRALGTDLASIPAQAHYLYADESRRDGFAATLGPRTKPRIGLAWSGNPAHANDANRSIAFGQLSPMLSDSADWICLQNEIRPGDRAALTESKRVRFMGQALRDFADTAALLDLMDLVITVDTSIAHLAGALGKPVWILLPFRPDWRWLLGRADSPWYPSARLFRQPRIGDWAGVIDEVRKELAARIG